MLPTKILIPVDGSENCKRANDFALELSKKIGASMVFLHVIDIPISSYRYRLAKENLFSGLDEAGWSLLGDFEAKAKSKGIPCDIILTHGDPATQILAIAKKRNCDCVVMGKRGLGRIRRILLGSVSDRVTRLAEVPVITVK